MCGYCGLCKGDHAENCPYAARPRFPRDSGKEVIAALMGQQWAGGAYTTPVQSDQDQKGEEDNHG